MFVLLIFFQVNVSSVTYCIKSHVFVISTCHLAHSNRQPSEFVHVHKHDTVHICCPSRSLYHRHTDTPLRSLYCRLSSSASIRRAPFSKIYIIPRAMVHSVLTPLRYFCVSFRIHCASKSDSITGNICIMFNEG